MDDIEADIRGGSPNVKAAVVFERFQGEPGPGAILNFIEEDNGFPWGEPPRRIHGRQAEKNIVDQKIAFEGFLSTAILLEIERDDVFVVTACKFQQGTGLSASFWSNNQKRGPIGSFEPAIKFSINVPDKIFHIKLNPL